MTFAISKELQFLAGHDSYVKLTLMGSAVPLRVYLTQTRTMSRQPRNFQPGFSYHVTTRCNNREFNLAQRECREVFLYAIKKALHKYGFKLKTANLVN